MSNEKKSVDYYETVGDVVYAITKGVISAVIPCGGELFSLLIQAPWEDRGNAWQKSVGDDVARLMKQNEELSIEKLRENEVFISAISQATLAAIRTHEKEKLKALRNAVLNSALPTAPDEDLQHILVHMIDTLTPWHLRVMKSVNALWSWHDERTRPDIGLPDPYFVPPCPHDIMEKSFPGLQERPDFFDFLLRDLSNRGLLAVTSGHGGLDGKDYCKIGPTPLGIEFRKFITSPIAE
jgi:hypothetical protein